MFSRYELLSLDQPSYSSDPFKILILQFLIPRVSLSPSSSLPNLTLVNWNPSLTRSSSCSSSVSLPSLFDHTPPQVLDTLNHISSQANQIYYQAIYRSWYLLGQTRYQSKSWVFKDRFFFKVRQHGQQQLYLQCKVCWILYIMVGAPSFSQSYLCIQPYITPLQSGTKIHSSTSVNFHLPISSQNHLWNPH